MKENKWIWGLIGLAFGLIIFSFFAPYLLTGFMRVFSNSGQIGDTIGGLMNPFIAIAGVIITGLAFYMQYLSNKQVQLQFRSQKIESQVYEMIRFHKQNVEELSIFGIERQLNTNSTTDERHNVYGLLPTYNIINTSITKRNVINVIVKEFEILLAIFKELTANNLSQETYDKAYKIFFFGFEQNVNYNLALADRFENNQSNLNSIIYKIRDHLTRRINMSIDWDISDSIENELDELKIDFVRGHSDFLSHYFRHLFHTVKFIVSQDIHYDEKINYLRVLRAQLSNQEQALIFYNWIAKDFGGKWEGNEENDNRYLTEYCMIHNLWYDRLFKDEFIEGKVIELKSKECNLRTGKMFEI